MHTFLSLLYQKSASCSGVIAANGAADQRPAYARLLADNCPRNRLTDGAKAPDNEWQSAVPMARRGVEPSSLNVPKNRQARI